MTRTELWCWVMAALLLVWGVAAIFVARALYLEYYAPLLPPV